jgi:hypothetical protein
VAVGPGSKHLGRDWGLTTAREGAQVLGALIRALRRTASHIRLSGARSPSHTKRSFGLHCQNRADEPGASQPRVKMRQGLEVGAVLRIDPRAARMRTDLVRARKARILIRALYTGPPPHIRLSRASSPSHFEPAFSEQNAAPRGQAAKTAGGGMK